MSEVGVGGPVVEYDNFVGYIVGELGKVPDDGSHFERKTKDLIRKVGKVKEHQVVNRVVKIIEHPQEEEEESKGKERE